MEHAEQPGMGCFGCLLRGIILLFAFIGFVQTTTRLFGPALFETLMSPLLVREVTRTVPAPDRMTTAQIEVTRGGLGTVWTTRVHLLPKEGEGWTIYQTKDSDYTPQLRWLDRDTLLVGLGCESFGHLSNPDDWERSDKSERRRKVRFYYADPACAVGIPHSPQSEKPIQ